MAADRRARGRGGRALRRGRLFGRQYGDGPVADAQVSAHERLNRFGRHVLDALKIGFGERRIGGIEFAGRGAVGLAIRGLESGER